VGRIACAAGVAQAEREKTQEKMSLHAKSPARGGAEAATRVEAGEIAVRAIGRSDYETCWRAMRDFTDRRDAGTQDEIWLTEHAPIYTLGLAGRREHLKRENGIPVLRVDRGGQVTYHGPGQLVAYTLIDLARAGLSVRDMVRHLEIAVILWLESLGIAAYGKPCAPGVYTVVQDREAKIAALGLRIRHGCSYHGLAVNIAMELAPFDDIDPCGYPGLAVTQLMDLDIARTVDEAGAELAPLLVRGLTAPRSI
jgi:lipoyl(octanoyl) transferase